MKFSSAFLESNNSGKRLWVLLTSCGGGVTAAATDRRWQVMKKMDKII
jgi:hypothetical protein